MSTVVPHLDDVAGSHGANRALFELAATGAVTCGSVMVPGPWFPEVAAHPDLGDLDLGVHLTLTSESAAFRWRPVSTTNPASGLLDGAGYLWPTVPQLRACAEPGAVATELRAQLDAALAAGIDVTHLDSHMGAALAPEFIENTVQIAREYRLPLLFPSDVAGYFAVLDAGEVDLGAIDRVRDSGVAVADSFVMPLVHQGRRDHVAVLQEMLTGLAPGVSYLSLHCSTPGEIEQIHPKDAAWRIGEYAAFSDPTFQRWMADQPFTIAGMGGFRDEVRSA